MSDQLRINDRGQIESQPIGESVRSQDTPREQPRLFTADAFAQIPGQLPFEQQSAEQETDR